jgi:hypothetical protein
MAKGGQFERDVARNLSLWWSKDKRDDLCWRSSQSGGRATVRHRKGKKTAGHCGDLCATNGEMAPFFETVTVEIKKGYNNVSIAQVIDKAVPRKPGKRHFAAFVLQAHDAAKRAGTKFWWLIHKRDGRQTMIYLPRRDAIVCDEEPIATVDFAARTIPFEIAAFTLDDFLEHSPPEDWGKWEELS